MPARYKTSKNPDGTFCIHDVPIFGEVPKGERGNDEPVGIEFHRAAIANAKKEESERGYLPPLHIHHHGFDKPERAGHFRVTRTGKTTYEGREMATLFADLVAIPEVTFHRIMAGEFPYRSAEVFSFGKDGRINSLALLDTEEPFFRFPLLNAETIDVADVDVPALSGFMLASDGKARALFSFKEATVPEVKLPASLRPLFANIETGNVVSVTKQGDDFTWGGQPVVFEEDDKKDGMPDDEKGLKALIAKAQAKLKKLQGDDPDDKDDGKPNPKPAETAKAQADPELVAQFAKLEARLSAMEQNEETRKAVETTREIHAKAVKNLRDGGWFVSDKVDAALFKQAEIGGQVAVDVFVETFKANVPKDPTDKLPKAAPVEDPAVAKFIANNPDRAKEIRAYAEEHKAAVKRFGLTTTLEEYIARRLADKKEVA